MTQVEERNKRNFNTVTRDRIEAVYEAPAIRRIKDRLELLEAKAHPLDDAPQTEPDADTEERREKDKAELELRLAELREDQSSVIDAENPRFHIVIQKPGVSAKSQLLLLNRSVHAEQMALMKEKEEYMIREGIRESARTTMLIHSNYESEEAVEEGLKDILIYQLLMLEGKTDQQLAVVSDFDPDLVLTEEEEDRLRVSDTLEGSAMAQAMLERRQERENLLNEKRIQIVQNRMEEVDKYRATLKRLPEESLLDKITWIELSARAMAAAQQEYDLHYLLFCVRDASKPRMGHARNKSFIKGYEPFFTGVEEVRDVRQGMPDFYEWLLQLRNRLDYLTEEEIYGLAEYEPFRSSLQPLLRPRRQSTAVADFLRSFAG